MRAVYIDSIFKLKFGENRCNQLQYRNRHLLKRIILQVIKWKTLKQWELKIIKRKNRLLRVLHNLPHIRAEGGMSVAKASTLTKKHRQNDILFCKLKYTLYPALDKLLSHIVPKQNYFPTNIHLRTVNKFGK